MKEKCAMAMYVYLYDLHRKKRKKKLESNREILNFLLYIDNWVL